MATKLPLVIDAGDVRQTSKSTDLLDFAIADPVNPSDPGSKNYIDAAIASITQGSGTQLISGGGVVWTGGLNFTVAAATYSILGTTYTSPQTDLVLGAADPTNPRIDIIALNTSSAAVVIAGTPAANPLLPNVDPSTQFQLTFVYVAAGASTPANITSITLYAENAGDPAEWNTSSTGSTWALASTNNPRTGTKDIEATSLTGGASVTLQKGTGTLDLSTLNNLIIYIRSKATWAANRALTIQFQNAGVLVGNSYSFKEGSFGFVSSNTTSYQQIVIPLSTFSIGNSAVNQLKFTAAGSGGSAIGFYLDDISLQGGVTVVTGNFLAFKGNWSPIAYAKNDVVISDFSLWVALNANSSSKPRVVNTNWQEIGNFIDQIITSGDINNPEIVFADDGTIMRHLA